MTARIRMKYTKTGRVRFISHLDFMTLIHRAAVRANVPVAFSQGFNPHPRISFGPALSVGMESDTEFLDIETDPLADLLQMTRGLNNTLPQGVRILESRVVPKKAPSLSGSISRYVYEVQVPEQYQEGIAARVADFLSRASVIVSREGKQKDIRPGIESITAGSGGYPEAIDITLVDRDQLKPRVQDVLAQLFGAGQEQTLLLRVMRCGLYYKDGGQWKSPMDV
jgi:radical SAM-linked protein